MFSVPVTLDVPFVPVAVNVCVCVASALPVNVWAATVLDDPAKVGTFVGHAIVGV